MNFFFFFKKAKKPGTDGVCFSKSQLFSDTEPIHLVFPNTEGHLGGAEMCLSDMLNFAIKDDDI